MHFVTESIALTFKDVAQKNFAPNLCLRMGECNKGIIYGYKM